MGNSSKSNAGASAGANELQWIPVVVVDEATETLHIFCTDNVQAVAAVQVASERGLTAKRFKARSTDPAPIEIRVTDERPRAPALRQEIPVFDVSDVGGGVGVGAGS
jgi:hypothetical protein